MAWCSCSLCSVLASSYGVEECVISFPAIRVSYQHGSHIHIPMMTKSSTQRSAMRLWQSATWLTSITISVSLVSLMRPTHHAGLRQWRNTKGLSLLHISLQIATPLKCVHRKSLDKASLPLSSTTLPSYESFSRNHDRMPCTSVALAAGRGQRSKRCQATTIRVCPYVGYMTSDLSAWFRDDSFLYWFKSLEAVEDVEQDVIGSLTASSKSFLVVIYISWQSYRQDVTNLYYLSAWTHWTDRQAVRVASNRRLSATVVP